VFWSETGELCCIATEESYFVLKYDSEAVAAAAGNPDKVKDKTLFILFCAFLNTLGWDHHG
jgi:hypothetical protein